MNDFIEATIEELVWLSGLTDQALADAVLSEEGHEGTKVVLPSSVLQRALDDGRRRDAILREHIARALAHWTNNAKHLALEHRRLLQGMS